MSHDGAAEAANILARLQVLAGGRFVEDAPDDAALPLELDGSVRPHGHVSFSVPIAAARGRGLVGEALQPHVFHIQLSSVGSSKSEARALDQAVGKLLVGWNPSTTGNATDLTARGGQTFASIGTTTKPTRWTVQRRMACTINLADS